MNDIIYDKIKIFEKELSFIKNDKIREFAEKAIEKIPDYFFEVGASSTGKYHPSYALGDGGLRRHTQAAVRIAIELFRVDMFKYTEDEKDLIIVALILHDSRKSGENHSQYTLANHPVIAKESIENDEDLKNILTNEQLDIILNGILTHMGQWNQDFKTKEVLMPKPNNGYQNFIHWCDYLASRKCLEFNFDIEVNRE